MKNKIWMMVAVMSVFTLFLRCDAKADDFPKGVLAYMSLDDEDRSIEVAGPGALTGTYYPSDDPDNDMGDTTKFDRYRVEGKFNKGLRFFREDKSYAKISGFELGSERKSLAISLFVKMDEPAISSLVTCKTDMSRAGFAFSSRGKYLSFEYGDGKKTYKAQSKSVRIGDGEWHLVEMIFSDGRVGFYVDNKEVGEVTLAGKTIAPSKFPLTLGNYPASGRGRDVYGFDGVMDEVMIAENGAAIQGLNTALAENDGRLVTEKELSHRLQAIFDAQCQPVNGNERHFGQATFNSFFGRPVPLSFIFTGDKAQVESPAFVLYLPEDVVVRELFSSQHGLPDVVIETDATLVTRDGQPYTRYETVGFDITRNLTKTWSLMFTAALDRADRSKDTATVYWALEANGEEYAERSFLLRFLEPLPDEPNPGQFEIMNYFLADDMAFHDKSLQESMAKLYLSSGLRGKGRFYASDKRRSAFDLYLKEQGFTLYEVSLWGGPLTHAKNKCGVPQALSAQGEESKKYLSPAIMLNSQEFRDTYIKDFQSNFSTSGEGDWVALDFEPWGVPGKICFRPETIAEFKKRFDIQDDLPGPQIVSKYKKEWSRFWCEMSAEMTELMVEAARATHPGIKVTEYAYLTDYDDPELWKRFLSIPKDLRLHTSFVDEFMLSVYHIHHRAAFDALNDTISENVLGKEISVIVMLGRETGKTAQFTAPEDNISPQQMYQKTVMCASLGIRHYGLYPGLWIDGAFHEALGRASRVIWKNEKFFLEGTRCDEKVSITPLREEAAYDDYAHVLWEKDGEYLLSLFNFTGSPMSFSVTLSEAPQTVVVEPYDVALLTIR